VTRTFTGALLEARRLEPGTDLVRIFLTSMLELIDCGWHLGEFSSSSASVHCHRGIETRMLAIIAQDPEEDYAKHLRGSSACPDCED
jgi:hypothetical protein